MLAIVTAVLLVGPAPVRADDPPSTQVVRQKLDPYTQEVLQKLDGVYAVYVNCLARTAVLALEVEDEETRGRILKALVEDCKEERRVGVLSAGIIPTFAAVIRGEMDTTLWPPEQWARSKAELAELVRKEEKPFKPIMDRYLRCLGQAVVAAEYLSPAETAGVRLNSLKDQCRRERFDATKRKVITHTEDGRKLSPTERLKLALVLDARLDSDLVADEPTLHAVVQEFIQMVIQRPTE